MTVGLTRWGQLRSRYVYCDAKFKMAKEIKRSLLRDVIRDLGAYHEANFRMANEIKQSLLRDSGA